jgi:amino acid/amide ABC transporter ATP-binding protein 2, HAAT family (TC 3.A.1.4.-)
MVDKIFEVVEDISKQGVTILLVEQNAKRALGLADRGYVMDSGSGHHDRSGRGVAARPRVRAAYLGE